jgi:CSLREA domain-containing protein
MTNYPACSSRYLGSSLWLCAFVALSCWLSPSARGQTFDFSYDGTSLSAGNNSISGDVSFADLNGDRLNDAVMSIRQGALAGRHLVYLGDGRGGFTRQPDLQSPGNKGISALADLNGDGKIDFVTTGSDDSTLRVRLGNGDGTFGGESVFANAGPAPGVNLGFVKLADITGDGILDAVTGATGAGVRVLKGTGDGGFLTTPYFAFDGRGVNDLEVLDLDGDGTQDIVFAGQLAGSDIVSFTRLQTGQTLAAFEYDIIPGGLDAFTALTVQRVGNQVLFAIAENSQGSQPRRLYWGTNPLAPANVTVAPQTQRAWAKPAIADFDGDGVPDLAAGYVASDFSLPSVIQFYSGQASGSPFSTTVASSLNVGVNLAYITAAHLDADGNLDVLAGTLGSGLGFQGPSVFLNNRQSLVVSTTADEDNANARWNSGTGTSLREAVNYARTLGGNQTVSFAPFLGNANATINVAGQSIQKNLNVNLTVENTRGQITLQGSTGGLFSSQGSLTLRNLTIRDFIGGNGLLAGGAIFADAFSNLTIENCTFVNNTAGVNNPFGPQFGGAIVVDTNSTVTIRNSTFTGNGGDGAIALFASGGTCTLENNTISGNTNKGLLVGNGNVVLRNNLIAGNSTSDVAFVAGGGGTLGGNNNLIQTGNVAGLTGTINANPLLNPLAYSLGITPTMSLQSGSPAINAGTPLATVTRDQRGVPRPQGSAPDIGAFEVRLPETPTLANATINVFTNSPAVDLAAATGASPTGGMFSGTGIVNNAFDPAPRLPSNYPFTYTVSGGDGINASVNGTIVVQNTAPTNVQFTVPVSVSNGQQFTLTGSFVDPDAADTFTVTFNWGHGQQTSTTITNGARTFTTQFTYPIDWITQNRTITVTVQDTSGAQASAQNAITVTQPQGSLVVNTLADENDGTANPGFGTGTSLREAVEFAAASPGDDTVLFQLTFSTFVLGSQLSLGGAGHNTIDGGIQSTIAGNGGAMRILNVTGTWTLRNLTATGGRLSGLAPASWGAGALVNTGASLTVDRCLFLDHESSVGGGITSRGTLHIVNSTFTNNRNTVSTFNSGVIWLYGGTGVIRHSTFTGNSGPFSVKTESGAVVTFDNNIVWGNGGTAVGRNSGTFSGSNNLIQSGDTTGLTNTINADPLLGSLAPNGGPTQTIALLSNSPAIDAAAPIAGITIDQRGVARPVGVAPDLGAFENADTALQRWRAFHSLPANGSQDLANPSSDGVANLLKFAFNMAPNLGDLLTPNTAVLPENGTAGLPFITRDAQGRLFIEFVRRKATSHPGVGYLVETGADLSALTALDLAAATVTSINATWERVTVIDPVITPNRFGRLRIVVLAP